MASEEVSVIALVENLELTVPRRLPSRLLYSQEQPKYSRTSQTTRIIELSDRDSKIALKRQLNLDVDSADGFGKSNEAFKSEERESFEILRRLPPGTVLIKQVETKDSRKVDDDEEERTTSEEAAVNEKPKKISQRIRNKKTLEVRRNPLRSASRRDNTRSSSSRQRLLAARRHGSANTEQSVGRRTRTAPYMNTRSVTRKLCNVGATYVAPTRRDETQWKEWPVHGMHERPVYHPQFGLAAEYNGRLFASFDGESYREINTDAQIEIVRVDPRVDSLDGASNALNAMQYLRRQSNSAADIRQKLQSMGAGQTTSMTGSSLIYGKIDSPKLPSFGGLAARPLTFEHLQSTLGLTYQQHHHHRQQQQQLDHFRKLERLHHLENLQRLGSRVRLQSVTDNCSQAKFVSGRLLSKEMFHNLQNATLVHAHHQQSASNIRQSSSPSKCLIVPRATAATTPITLPFCVKGNTKGKLFFVRATDAAKKLTTEKISTITSSTQRNNLSWNETSLRKKFENSILPTLDTSRLAYAVTSALDNKTRQSRLTQQLTRGFPPLRLAESTGIFRPSLQKVPVLRDDPGLAATKCNGGDFDFRNAGALDTDDHSLSEVLDLSKKEPSKEDTAKMDVDSSCVKDEANGI